MQGNLTLPYGDRELSLKLLHGWDLLSILAPQSPDTTELTSIAIERSLRNTAGCIGLSKVASNNKEVAIIIDDKTRPTPAGKLIPIIFDELKRAGVKEKDVAQTVGRGLHPKMAEKDMVNKLGTVVIDLVNVEDHNADSVGISLGKTSNNVLVSINATVAGSDMKIDLSSIFPTQLGRGKPVCVMPMGAVTLPIMELSRNLFGGS